MNINPAKFTHQISMREAVRHCDDLVREFKQEYPGLRSQTKIALKKDKANSGISFFTYNNVENKYGKRIREMRNKFFVPIPSNYELNIKKIDILVRSAKHANCGEMATLMQYPLLNAGIPVKKVGMNIIDPDTGNFIKKTVSDHCFLLYKLTPPKYSNKNWKKISIIIDPWLGKAGKAQEIINEYKDLFKINKTKEMLNFKPIDYINVNEYAAKHTK